MTSRALPLATDLPPGIALPCLIRGTWQLHERAGQLDTTAAIDDLLAGFDLGFTAIEASDSYDGVEELLGHFRQTLLQTRGLEALERMRIHTRVTQTGSMPLDATAIKQRIERSRSRLEQGRLDLVQLQWWNFAVPGWREAAQSLQELRETGIIQDIGLTNFPTAEMQQLLDDGITVFSNQVQISLLDRRAGSRLLPACRAAGIKVFGYGPLAGGFLTDAWHGEPDPGLEPTPQKPFGKVYRQLIEHFGGWDWLQTLLDILHQCARRHDSDIASIALAWTLRCSGAIAMLVGMSSRARAAEYAKAASLPLTAEDIDTIGRLLADHIATDDVTSFERSHLQSAIAASYTS